MFKYSEFANFQGANSTLIYNRRTRTHHKHTKSYGRYYRRMMKEVCPEMQLSSTSIAILDDLIKDLFLRIVREASNLAEMSKRKTMLACDIEGSIRLVLNGQLINHAAKEAKRALKNLEQSSLLESKIE
ncbi:histone H2B-like [Chironomus tepperi]|uniref:histone H2B-like n=1 Tax=Chironomus tepperi TaxID=113505 RepID=UPI00391F5C49